MEVEAILSHLESVRKSGSGWSARCPAHEDRRSSLSISAGDDGKVLLHCHAGCSTEEVVDKLGISIRDLMPTNGTQHSNGKAEISKTYGYTDEQGNLLYQVVRMIPKDFRQRKPKPGGGWEWKVGNVRRVPYRLPELLSAKPEETIFVVEGEKDVGNLVKLGLVATCNAGGADSGKGEKWLPEFAQHFRGRRVAILPDKDSPGRKHAQHVAAGLQGIAAEIRVVELPGAYGKDVSDWIEAGGTVEELLRIVEAAPTTRSSTKTTTIVEDVDAQELPGPIEWPVLGQDAYQGIAGRIVRMIEPETEADPVAILAQLLVMAGNIIGRQAHYIVEGNSHHCNLFAVLVGSTARGRKGTSEGRVRQILRSVDQEWADTNIKNGLVSGEGLVWSVRDPIYKTENIKEKGRIVGTEEVLADAGVNDKRLLVVESEFASTLRVCKREQNTLSPTLRTAWDSGSLRTMSKNSPAKATDAHISIIGHITAEELRAMLAEVDGFNGFANRFLWVAVRRSKLLPDGGRELDLSPYADRLTLAMTQARAGGRMQRDSAAAALWRQVYTELADDDSSGLLAAVTSRAEAQVLRLSMIYALLDCSSTIRVEHLRAALAIWRYCRGSAEIIFGGGNPLEAQVLDIIRQQPGVARKGIYQALGNHVRATTLVGILAKIRDAGKARPETVPQAGGGRPTERWFPCEHCEHCEHCEQTPAGKHPHNPEEGINSQSSQSSQGWSEFNGFSGGGQQVEEPVVEDQGGGEFEEFTL
jgi:5S rRNA maturation endonuclease (ribonuclease M5)